MRRALLIIIAVAAVGAALSLATPATAGGGGCHGEATEATASMVELRKACFTPTVTRVGLGQQVAFVNRDGLTHNVIGLGALWGDIEGMDGGETRRFTFKETGIFPYACTLHVGMVGAVVVGRDETHAGDVGAVDAASSSGSGGPGDTAATPSRRSSSASDPRLPAVALVLAAMVLAAVLVLRRRRESPAGS